MKSKLSCIVVRRRQYTAPIIRTCWYWNSVTIRQQVMARASSSSIKGMVNNKFNHFIMSKLAEAGIPTQMEALLSDTECLVKNWIWCR